MATLVIEVDAEQAVKALKKLQDNLDKTGKNADKSFNKAGNSIGALAGPIGIATIGIGALSVAFVQLAKVATQAFIDITKDGIALNAQFETSARVFSNLFDDPELGKATLNFLRQTATELRINQAEAISFAQSILPRTSDLETFRELLRLTDIQADVTGQSVSELEFSIREALTGDFVSLKDRFDISKDTVDRIRELGKEIGLDKALAQELGAEFERLGKADISGTLQTDLKDIQSFLVNLQAQLGVSPFEELRKQAQAFLEVIDEQGENIGFVASAFGDLAANVIEFVGSGINEFIEGLDFAAIEVLVDSFNRALAAAELVVDVLFEIPDTTDGINQITVALIETQVALENIAIAAGKAKLGLEASFAIAKALFQIKTGNIVGALETIGGLAEIVTLENQADIADETEAAFGRYERRIKAVTEAQNERRDSTNESTQADQDAINAALANTKAVEELAKAQSAAAEAQEKIGETTAKAEADRQKRLTDLIRKESEQRFDDAIKAAQRREDLARKNAQAIEDIFTKQDQAIVDAATDLSRDEQDIARSAVGNRQAIERDAANERLDIERDFRQELERIQRRFNQDAEDAERNNDAQAFLRAVRARDEQVEVATSERDISLEDAGRQAQEQREVLREQLAAEIEDARIANARKLEDLRLRLNQELEAQAIKIARQIEEEAIRDQRLAEKRALELEREVADFQRKEEEIRARLNDSLNQQLAIIEAAKAKEVEVTALAEAAKTSIVQEEAAKRASILAATQQAQALTGTGLQEFQQGGRPPVGSPVVVGEGGPEVFVPDIAGTIIPNASIFSPPSQPGPLGGGGNSVTNNSPTFNLAEGMFSDPIARRNLTNFVLGVLAGEA